MLDKSKTPQARWLPGCRAGGLVGCWFIAYWAPGCGAAGCKAAFWAAGLPHG